MMVSKKNQCADCGTEMEFHFSSGNYVCIKCFKDDRELVFSPEEIHRIDLKTRMEKEAAEAKAKVEAEAKAKAEAEAKAKAEVKRKAEEKHNQYKKYRRKGIFQNIVRELEPTSAVSKHSPIHVTAYHMTDIKNLRSILQYGIFSNAKLNEMGITSNSISNNEIMKRRENKFLLEGENLMNWCPTYFIPGTAMWRKLKKRNEIGIQNLVMLKLDLNIRQNNCFVTDQNAACNWPTFVKC